MNELDIAKQASATMHASDHSAHALGFQIQKVRPGYAELTMQVRKEFTNGYGVCQGGLIATLADAAFAHACNAYNRKTVAQGFSIDFIRPGLAGDTLTAIAQEKSRGKLTGVYQVEVRNSAQKLIAFFKGNSFEIGGAVIDTKHSDEQ